MSPHKYSPYVLPKYCYWALINILYISSINCLGPSHKYYSLYPTYYPTRVFTKILTILLPYWATKLYNFYKKPKSIYLVGKSKKPNKTHSKAHYDTVSLKLITIWHSKTHYDTAFLKLVTIRHFLKARCYAAIFLQNPTKSKC